MSRFKCLAICLLAATPLISAASLKGTAKEIGELQGLPTCKGQYYDPLQYSCFGDEQLCPWQNGFPQQRCGITDKCYLPFRYDCDNGTLIEIQEATGPFELIAVNLRELAYVKVKACGNRFWLRDGEACTLCPQRVNELGNCPPGVDTVFLPGRSMNTLVPGGQRYFVNPTDGALHFSVPHSGVDTQGAIYDFLALDKGTFAVYPGARGWMACPANETDVGGPNGKVWQVRAQLPQLEFEEDCVPVNLVTKPWKPAGNVTVAAWEYI